jgi:bifunctional DNA-binding transcriptional regulator/antitoxin component of YhaV-PrlF toxin-antitoxin module
LNYSKDAAILYSWLNSKEDGSMPKVSSKRQITLPVDQCRQVGIEPGDEYQSFVADGHITIVKKVPGAAKGILKHVKGDTSVTDEASLQSALD